MFICRLRFANPARHSQHKDSLTVETIRERKSSHRKSRKRSEDQDQQQQQLSSDKTPLPPLTSKNRNTDLVDVSDIISAANLDSKIIQDLSMGSLNSGNSERKLSNKNERKKVKEILMKNSRGMPLKSLNRRDSNSGRDILKSVNSILRRGTSSPTDEETPTKGDIRGDVNEGLLYNSNTQLKTPQSNTSMDSARHRKSTMLRSRADKKSILRKDSLQESESRLLRRQRVGSPEEKIAGILVRIVYLYFMI